MRPLAVTVLVITMAFPASRLCAAADPVVLRSATLAARAEAASAAVADIRRLAASGQPAVAVARARTLLGAPGLDAPVRERLRYETVMALSQQLPEPSGRQFVEESLAASPTVFVRLDEDAGHEIIVAAWDAPAAARYALRRWEERAAADQARRLLEGGGDLASAWRDLAAPGRRGLLEVLDRAPDAQVAAASASLASGLAAAPHLAVPSLVVAARTADAGLFSRAMAVAPREEAVAALRDRLGAFSPPDRVGILTTALERDDLASAALLALAAASATEPAAETVLWGMLGHPDHGASAAAALARLPGADVDERLRSLAANSPMPAEAQWASLALDLREQQRREAGR